MQPLDNVVFLRGNLGNDPELRKTHAGVPVCNFNLATNEFYYDDDGRRQKRVEWHKITVWGTCAEQCGKALEKGREIRLMGKIQTRKWQDKGGETRYTTEIHTTNVEFGRYPMRDGDADEYGEDDLSEDSL